MMKLFGNSGRRTFIQPANLVALETDCVGYYLVVPKAAAGACRRPRRSVCSRDCEPEISITWTGGRLGCRSRAQFSVSSQASLPHRRLPNCAEVGAHLRRTVGLERLYARRTWRTGHRPIRQLPRSPGFVCLVEGIRENLGAGLPPLSLNNIPEVSHLAFSTAPTYTISRTVPEVRLQFTVADEHGRLVQDLLPDDIRVLDDQSPVAKFDDFARDENLPLHLGIILDASDSVKRVLDEEKAAALDFLDRVLRPQSDRAFVMAFGADLQVWQAATNDRGRLIQAVNRLHQAGWGTLLFDALHSACVDHLPNNDDGALVHRAIVVLSDGDDTDSFHSLPDVIAAAQRSEIQIYALTVHKKGLRPAGDIILRRLADETGGGFFVARSAKELQGAFAEIEQEMRTQYFVSFPPQQSTPGFHALQVEVLRPPQKLQVHARRGYYAAAP